MKVLLVTDPTSPGWVPALELGRALPPLGVEPTLAIGGTRLTPAARGLARAAFGARLFERPAGRTHVGEWLLDLEYRAAPDVIHSDTPAHGVLGWTAPLVVALQDWPFARRGPLDRGTARSVLEPARVVPGLAAAAIVSAPTRWMLRAAERLYGPFRRGVAVPYGRSGKDLSPYRKEPLIVATARSPDRRMDPTERLAPRLRWPVRLRPPGPLGPELRSALRTAGVFVHPVEHDPGGLAPLEAGLAGCALVLADLESLRELWEGAAIFVDPTDERAIEDAIRELITDPGRRAVQATRASLRAGSLSPERMASGYRRVYLEAIGAATAAAPEAG
jgi:hypothetical protein